MSARAYREKIVKPFLSKILGMTKLIIARAKSCFAELMKVQEELETVKEERDALCVKLLVMSVLCCFGRIKEKLS